MTEPERFRTRRGDVESLLFESLEDDAPPAGAQARVVAALGAASAQSAAAAAASVKAPQVGWTIIAKWMAAGAATALVTVGTAVTISVKSAPGAHSPAATAESQHSPESSGTRTATRLRDARDQRDPTALAIVSPPRAAETPPSTVVPLARARSPRAPLDDAAPPPASRFPDSISPESTLAQEVASLDDARKVLERGDASGALRRLEAYAASFPAPSLGPEAALLRVQALLASGDRVAAEALAKKVVAASPGTAIAARMLNLFDRDPARAPRLSDQNTLGRPRAE